MRPQPGLTDAGAHQERSEHHEEEPDGEGHEHDLQELAEEHHQPDVDALRPAEMLALELGLEATHAPGEPQQEEPRGKEHEEPGCDDELRQPAAPSRSATSRS